MDTLTPMLRQYRAIKAQHPDAILMFRLGDFYEMFYDDALLASRALSLTLTARGRGTSNEAPMCGVPYHAADGYVARLIQKGHRVAICDQVEDARAAKGIVRRAVTRVVSPGTVTDPAQLRAAEPNYIAAIQVSRDAASGARGGAAFGCAFLDLSTGDFRLSEHGGPGAAEALATQVALFRPREILHPEGTALDGLLPKDGLEGVLGHEVPGWTLAADTAARALNETLGVATLAGFGVEERHLAVGAAGALLHYLQEAHKADLKHVTRITWCEPADSMVLDETTRRTLEVAENARDGGRDGTLLDVLDRTRTAMGGRLLRDWVLRPLLSVRVIEDRLDGVAFLVERAAERAALRAHLSRVHDLERLLAHCSMGTANARDLVALRDSLAVLPEIAAGAIALTAPPLARLMQALDVLDDLRQRLDEALADDPPATVREGGLIRDGFYRELDDLRAIRRDGRAFLASIETRERERTGIASLKVRYNKVFGYYLEVSNAHRKAVPTDYERKQTLVGAERYVTPELKEYEAKVLTSQERIEALEYELFVALRGQVVAAAPRLRATAAALAALDALAAFAEAAALQGYQRPKVDDSLRLRIVEGRHPVVERLLEKERFVPNDCLMDADSRQILILTGPNMGGKSTYLRQVALIVLMAQAGSFVPAAEAEIGMVDRIFSRVGASDNLARGQSTFLVEMIETANILNNATVRSIILLDEVGRGTSTFDGLSIAWSVAEYLHDTPAVAARTLFATHYHEMIELAILKPRVANLTMAVREWNDTIVFLRRVLEGAADRSYGIHVARLAGLPRQVIDRAREVLANLEREELSRDGRPKLAGASGPPPKVATPTPAQLGLFAPEDDPVLVALREVELDGMTPLEALNLLADLKKRLGS
ncbi:MAG TPA: DNA mismatch repair protein MutS [Candidatus Polarisedimenticolia bacterium]|nr:DNA mismatch repair protein MutS [Candidatus Polarisedimenticolia bacterium]